MHCDKTSLSKEIQPKYSTTQLQGARVKSVKNTDKDESQKDVIVAKVWPNNSATSDNDDEDFPANSQKCLNPLEC